MTPDEYDHTLEPFFDLVDEFFQNFLYLLPDRFRIVIILLAIIPEASVQNEAEAQDAFLMSTGCFSDETQDGFQMKRGMLFI